MIVTVVSGLIFLHTRMMMEVFPPGLRKLWKKWELRAMVFVSLTCQIVLILLGNRRKYIPRSWIKAVVWSAYLLADSVATIALGILLNDLGDIFENGGHPDKNTELTAFWAPFFLLHLGGPDTITAYALEDNELFLRHAFQLIVQTLATLLIFFTAWNGSRPSILAIPMIIAGFIKYAERTGTLWLASSDHLRESMLSPPEAGPNYHKFMGEYCLKHAEGYMLETVEMADAQAVKIDAPESQDELTSDDNIKHAHALFQMFKCLFADLILSNQERGISQTLLQNMPCNHVFNVIAIELGLMYDLLYTKAPVVNSRWGLARRFITSSLTCLAFVIFFYADKKKYPNKVDIHITFLLLGVAIALEIHAALLLVFSDQSRSWFIKQKKTAIFQPILFLESRLKLPRFLEIIFKPPRWSNRMGQYSFTWCCLDEEPFSYKVLKFFHLNKLWEKLRYKTYIPVPEVLKVLIFDHVMDKHQQFEKKQSEKKTERDTTPSDSYTRGKRALAKLPSLGWSVDEVEFDQSILIWHIATELCYDPEGPDKPDDTKSSCSDVIGKFLQQIFDNISNFLRFCCTDQDQIRVDDIKSDRDTSKLLSQYMMHLLVMYPFLLPVGIGLIRLRDTLCEAKKFLKERGSNINHTDKKMIKIEAWNKLLGVQTYVPAIKIKGDRCKSVLFDACRVASELNEIKDSNQKWELIKEVWLEMLTYAASQSRGSQHGRQLRRGGELLTHVWLLMAHFGMTEQFQISKGHARAYLIAK